MFKKDGKFEAVINSGIQLLCSDGKSATVMTNKGTVCNIDEPNRQVYLNEKCMNRKCGKVDVWTAIGRRGNKAVAAGGIESPKSIVFLLIDMETLTVVHDFAVSNQVTSFTRLIRMIYVKNDLFVVASRLWQFIDIFKIVMDFKSCKVVS